MTAGLAAPARPQAAVSRDYLWLAVILALALVLRIAALNGPLWFDEIVTLETHLRQGWGGMLSDYSMNHHYLHNLAAKASVAVFGESPWALRLPAMLFGLAAIAAMWALARDLAGPAPAHATALLLALSYHHIWFSQNARGYTGLALFSTLGLYLFLRGLRDPRPRTWLLFALALAATIFTHLTGAFFFLALGLVWLTLAVVRATRGRLDRATVTLPFMGFALGGLFTLALYAPVLPSLLSTVSGVAETSAGDPMQEYQNPLWTAYEGVRTAVGQAGPLVTLIMLAVLALATLGAVALRRAAPLFAPIAALHIALTVLLLLVVGMRIWPRFFFTDIAFLMFLIVLGVRLACDLLARLTGPALGRALWPLALTAMALLSAAMAARNYAAPKQDLAGAYAFVQSARQPGERVYDLAYAGEIFDWHFKSDWQTIWTNEEIATALAQPGPLTVVVTFPGRNFREYPALAAAEASGALTETRVFPGTLGDGGIVILRRD